jgi:subtilase family serine protease
LKKFLRFLFLVAVASFALTSATFAQVSMARNHVISSIDDFDAVTVPGNIHPLARPEFDRGLISAETRMDRMVLVLQPDAEQQKELDALVQAQHTPGSPLYHHWLTPQEYGQRFGASASDVQKTTAWLQSHGFKVEPVEASRRTIVFSGNASQVAEAFHTEIHRYNVNGELHLANSQDPQIPRALASLVNGVLSLHDFRRQPQLRFVHRLPASSASSPDTSKTDTSNPEWNSGGSHYLSPADYATIYDVNPLYSAGVTGSGVSIAIVGRSDINMTDVSSFRSNFGLPANQPTVIHDGTDPGINDTYGDQDESTLDVEWAGAVAYNASVSFVVARSTSTTDGIDLAAQYVVNNAIAPIVSTSYGSCEAAEGSTELAFYNNLWEQAASEGISAFVSSGDSGAAGCNGGSSSVGSVAGVNGLCSSPYSTCVGGTEFNEGSGTYWSASNGTNSVSAISYIPEKVWNESGLDGGSGLWAGGGGVSQAYTQPTWQAGISGSAANGMRTVPDVSLTAASHDGYLIWENGSIGVVAGTSAASPSFASIMSLVVQKQQGAGQGNANPTLYSLLDAAQNPFHPTLSGNNSVPGVNGFTAAGASYNLATGLGSVDADILVNEWPASGTTVPKSLTLTPSAASITLFPGTRTTFTLAAAGVNGYSGTVGLIAAAPTGVTVSFSSASVNTGSSTTVTVTAASNLAATAGNIVITGTSGSHVTTLNEGFTVASPAVTITPSLLSVTTFQGQSTTFHVTVGAASGYTSPIALSATAPSGVSVTFSPANIVPGATSTATVLASATAPGGTGAITLKGTAGSSSATSSVGVTVTVPTLTLTPNSSSVTSFQGQSTSFTVSAGATSGFTGLIALKATAPAGVTVTFSPASIRPGGTSTATVVPSTTATPGTGTIALAATAGTATASATEGVTVVAPTLSATASATSVSTFRGQSATYTVTVGATSGFTNLINLSATAPSGVAVNINPASVKPGSTATVTVVAATTAPAAAGTIILTAASGTAKATASTAVTVLVPTVTVTANTSSVSTYLGQAATYTVAVGATTGFTNLINLSATAPSGVTVSFSPTSVKPGGTATVIVAGAATASAGSGTVTVTGTSGVATATASTAVTLIAPTLTLTPSSTSLSTFRGQAATYTLAVGASSGYTNLVSLSATTPSGVTVSFNPASVKPGGTATVIVAPSTTAPIGAGSVVVTASSGAARATATTALTVLAPTLTLTPSATTLSIFRGQSTTFTLAVGATSGYTNLVSLTATAPSGVTVSINPASLRPGSTATITVAASTTAPVGTGAITVTAASGAATATATANVTVVEPTITLTPSTAALTVARGKSATFTIAVGASSGFGNVVALKATAPTGVTVSMASTNVRPGSSTTATVTVASTATVGTATITLTGTSGAETTSATESITVQ